MALSIKRVKDNPELVNKINQNIENKMQGIMSEEDEMIVKSDEI